MNDKKTLWKEANRIARLNRNRPAARAWRITKKLLALSSDARYAQKMETLSIAHAEIAPALADLAKAQQALENLSLA